MKIMMVGPSLEAQGGIATLARTFLESKALRAQDVRYFPTVGEGSKARKLAQMVRGQASFLKALGEGWDLVHIHVADGASFYRKMVYFREARAAGIPVVLHNNFAHLDELVARSVAHESLVRVCYSDADQVHAVSNDMRRQFEEWTKGKANVRVLFNPVPAKEFPFAGARGPKDNPIVLFMGRVGERKGIFDLIEAWPSIVQDCPVARLRVGGDGDLDRLNARIGELGIGESVQVLGWISGDDRLRAYRDADIYCLPSYAEGLPISVLEAMANGLAVVSTTANGIPDAVVEGETGFLLQAGDRRGTAARLVELLNDADLRDRFGVAARRRVEQVFDGEILAEQMVAYWEELLAERSAKAV
ncbi:MAG: glycosyltransferase family 4 protein [Proteobacteria bacterium]|nr:glycosyltransferase family 4 protein [Pseudomonadota bacterium]MCP4915521.1 glycosyltransferase family 4 protein [Pseudomonadota bacterium]